MSSGWRLLLHLHADRQDAAVDFLSIAVVWHYVSTIRVSFICYRLVRPALCIAKAHRQGTHEVAADCDRMELRWVEIYAICWLCHSWSIIFFSRNPLHPWTQPMAGKRCRIRMDLHSEGVGIKHCICRNSHSGLFGLVTRSSWSQQEVHSSDLDSHRRYGAPPTAHYECRPMEQTLDALRIVSWSWTADCLHLFEHAQLELLSC